MTTDSSHQEQTSEDPGFTDFESHYLALRRKALRYLNRERGSQSLSPTSLVHETYLSFARYSGARIADSDHFLRLAGRIMRNLIVDHARTRKARINGGGLTRIEWSDAILLAHQTPEKILALDCALDQLACLFPHLARLVELRYFAGFTEEETAQILGVATRTVRRQLRVAKARLAEYFSGVN